MLFGILTAMLCRPFLGFSYLHLAVLGLAIALIAELGDLSESLIKRDCQVKDSGLLFPGQGGFLDLIDSLLFTAPAFYFYMSNIKIIVIIKIETGCFLGSSGSIGITALKVIKQYPREFNIRGFSGKQKY